MSNVSPVAPFRPMTKADVAEVLGVCTKTIESWEKTGVIPRGQRLGAFVLWHPDVFYRWLDRRLKSDTVVAVDEAPPPQQEQAANGQSQEAPSSVPSARLGATQTGRASTPTAQKRTATSEAGRRAMERTASVLRKLADE